MKIVSEKGPPTGISVDLLDGTVLYNEEIYLEEQRRGEEIRAEFSGHISYKSPIMDPKGLMIYKEVLE